LTTHEALAVPVPAALVARTSEAAALFAAQHILPAGLISGRVMALAEASIRTMAAVKLKVVSIIGLVVVCGALVFGTVYEQVADAPFLACGCPDKIGSTKDGVTRDNETAQKPQSLSLSVDLPNMRPTVAEFNEGQFKVVVTITDCGRDNVVVWPYFSIKILDAKGEPVPPSRQSSRYMRSNERSVLEEMDFVNLRPGQAYGVEVNFRVGMNDPQVITSYQLPGKGEYTLQFNYHFDREAIKQQFGVGCKNLDDPDRPWNRAVDFAKKVEVKIDVAADEIVETPQARNPCPPMRPAVDCPCCEIISELPPSRGTV
jgi:hypothetical protein